MTTGVKDKRNNWEAYSYSPPSIGDVGVPLPFERTATYRGATDSTGANALEIDRFSYTYGGSGQSPRASRFCSGRSEARSSRRTEAMIQTPEPNTSMIRRPTG